MSEWISVKDRLPEVEDDVLVRVREIETYGRHNERKKTYNWFFVGYYDGTEWLTVYCHGCEYLYKVNESDPRCVHEVTHWMPLPEPPEEEQKNERI